MRIEHPLDPPRVVEDWEIGFVNGQLLELTIDVMDGDKAEYNSGAPTAYFFRSEKPSQVDPDGKLPAEEYFSNQSNVQFARKTKRLLEPISFEQKVEWDQLLRELTSEDAN